MGCVYRAEGPTGEATHTDDVARNLAQFDNRANKANPMNLKNLVVIATQIAIGAMLGGIILWTHKPEPPSKPPMTIAERAKLAMAEGAMAPEIERAKKLLAEADGLREKKRQLEWQLRNIEVELRNLDVSANVVNCCWLPEVPQR